MIEVSKVFCSLFFINFILYSVCNKYCGSDICNNNRQHTLCKFQSEDPARHCIDYEITIKTDKEKQAILDKLNSRRNKVASGEIRSLPSADNMMKLVGGEKKDWNKELEMSAQRWANQCVKHSIPDIKDTCRDLGNVYVGQNIATISGDAPGLTPLALVDVWYMELLNINASVLQQYQPSAETGYSHYDYFTQLMWADSSEVGCGGVKFKERIQDSRHAKNRTIYRLVCNFAPGGNWRNRSVYTEGAPCSRCENGYCDTLYKSLCSNSNSSKLLIQTEPVEILEPEVTSTELVGADPVINTEIVETVSPDETPIFGTSDSTTVEEDYTPFDYFSHLHQFTRQTLTPTSNTVSCKDVMAVDDFVELLKKKLSTDPMFKEWLQTTKIPPFHNDGGFTDASVAALVSRIYSKKMPPTTTKQPESEFVNSTLLVDLVEAVIFRKGEKVRNPGQIELRTDSEFAVSPVRIQAELPEVKMNADFTGHYFFPEDGESDDESTTETTESYYDISSVPISDVVLEIEELKRSKATKDFLDEILESDSGTESSESNNINSKREAIKKIDQNKYKTKRKKRLNSYRGTSTIDEDDDLSIDYISNESFELTHSDKFVARAGNDQELQYCDLLRKLASDLRILKLNERFHCSRNCSLKNNAKIFLIIFTTFLELFDLI